MCGIAAVFTYQSPKCLSPPAGRKGAQARVREGESWGGFRPQHQIRCHHAHVDAADDVCRALHMGHQQRLLQSQRGARLVQSWRVRLPVTSPQSKTLLAKEHAGERKNMHFSYQFSRNIDMRIYNWCQLCWPGKLGVYRSPEKSVDQLWMQSKLKNNLRGFIVLMVQSIREEIWKAGTKCSSHPFINGSALHQFSSHARGSSAAVPASPPHTPSRIRDCPTFT